MRFAPEKDDPENVGLAHAIKLLDPIYAKYKGLSYADLWILAAYVSELEIDIEMEMNIYRNVYF